MSPKVTFLVPLGPFFNAFIKIVAYLLHELPCHEWSKLQTKLTTLGYSRKTPKRVVEGILFWKPHGIFRFVTLHQEIQEKSFHRWDFCRIAWHPLQINKVKNQDPWKVHDFFLYTPGSSTSFLNDPWNFHMLFRQ